MSITVTQDGTVLLRVGNIIISARTIEEAFAELRRLRERGAA